MFLGQLILFRRGCSKGCEGGWRGGAQTIKKKILKPIFFLAYVLEGLKEVSPAPLPYALKNYFL